MGRFGHPQKTMHGAIFAWLAAALFSLAGCDRNGNASVSTGPHPTAGVEVPAQPPSDSGSDEITRGAADSPTDAAPGISPGNASSSDDVVAMPMVLMSHAEEETCLLNVNDTFPAVELADAEGQTHSAGELLGQRLSVVFLWAIHDTADDRQKQRARTDLSDLQHDIAATFADHGLQVLAINVGNSEEDVQDQVKQTDLAFPVLLDTQETLFGQLATERLPRVYLLDAEGRVLWFDIEFSRSTRRDLTQAIRYSLAEK